MVVTSCQAVIMMYKRVYLIFAIKMPRVAEVGAFCDPYSVSLGVAMKYKRVYLIFTTKIPGIAEAHLFSICKGPW